MTSTLERPVERPPVAPRTSVVPKERQARFRLDIGGLRAVAVLLVVLYHAHVPGITGGYVGVDVFFVISGFLITGQIVREIERRGRIDLVGFYARRMRRLLPPALIVIVATAMVSLFWGPLLQVRSTAKDVVYASVYAINFHLAAEGVDYQNANGPRSPLEHFWSLAVEEQFYLIWPIVIMAVTIVTYLFIRRAPRIIGYVVGVVALGGTAASLFWSSVLTARSAPLAYFSVQTRAWEFGVGAMIAVTTVGLSRVPRAITVPLSWAGVVGIVASAVIYNDETAFPGTAALFPVLATAAVIVAGCRDGVDRLGAARVLSLRPAQWLGKVSYGWYLWHWPMLVLAPTILGYDLSWIRGVEISILALWLAALTHFIVERPTQRPRLKRGRWFLLGIALSLTALGAGYAVAAAAPNVNGDGRYAQALDLQVGHVSRLTAALAAASRSNDVPGNLTPSLDRAANDVPITESGCHLNFLQTTEGPCAFGDTTARRTVVIFGDSHAQQWDAAFIAAARTAKWRVVSWTKAACPVADVTVRNPTLKRDYTECDTWRAATLNRIIALKPALVVASQSDLVPGRSKTNAQWATGTGATLRQLTDAGLTVDYFADTPVPNSDVPTCVAAHLGNTSPCVVSRAHAYAGGAAYYLTRHRMVTADARAAGATVVDPISWLCSSTKCPVIVANDLVYRDDSHISNTYSRLLGPVVEPLLTRATR